MKTLLKSIGVACLVLLASRVFSQENDCIEYGPHNGGWECTGSGYPTSAGSLTFSNISICTGGSFTPPTATGIAFANGSKQQWISYDCPSSSGYPGFWNGDVVTYTPGSVYFVANYSGWPAITGPFNTPGTYIYTAKVDGVASDTCDNYVGLPVGTFIVTVTSSTFGITAQPVSQTVVEGYDAVFSVVATGCPAPNYQWKFNGNNISGATSSTYTRARVQTADAGNYTVVVSSSQGTVTSSTAVLTVISSTLIDVDFRPDVAEEEEGDSKKGVAATGHSTNDFWNNYARDDGHGGYLNYGSLTNLKFVDETVSQTGLTITNAAATGTNGSSDMMYNEYLTPSNGGNIIIQFTNLATGTYDFYLYGHGSTTNDNSLFKLTCGSSNYLVRSTASTGSGWTNPPWVEGQQYVVFRGVLVSSNQPVVITVLTNALGHAIISGMQIARSGTPTLPGCMPPMTGAVSWWQAESNAIDLISGNNGTLYNSVTYTNGIYGYAFKLNGSGGHVRIPDNPNLRFTNAMTLQAWIYPTSVGGGVQYSILTKWDAVVGPDQRSYALVVGADGRPYLTVTTNGLASGVAFVWGSTTLTVSNWVHVAATYDGSLMRLYLNGTLDGMASLTNPIFPGTNDFSIGAVVGAATSGGNIIPFAGRIDEASVFNRALAQSEIQAFYDAGANGRCVQPAITSQPTDQTITYGNNATFSVTASGSGLTYQWRHNGQPISGATSSSYTLTKPAVSQSGGVYDVMISIGNTAPVVVSRCAVLTVNRAVLTVTAANGTRAYGATEPTFSVSSYTGFVSGENSSVLSGSPALSTPATIFSTVAGSPYPINLDQGTLSAANYSFSFVPGRLTITRVSLSVTADNASRFKFDTNPVFTGTITGVLNGDRISAVYTTSATPSDNAGTYSIVPHWVDLDNRLPNYNATVNNGTLTVSDAGIAQITLTTNHTPYMLGRPPTPLDSSAALPGGLADSFFNTTKHLKVSFASGQPQDYLSVARYGTNTGQVDVVLGSPNQVRYYSSSTATTIGTFPSVGTPSQPLDITFNTSTATRNGVEKVLQNLTVYNTSTTHSTNQRIVNMVFTDNSGNAVSPMATKTVDSPCPGPGALDVILVIDDTPSMAANPTGIDVPDPANPGQHITRFQAATNAAVSFLNYLNFTSDRVQILAFNGDPGSTGSTDSGAHGVCMNTAQIYASGWKTSSSSAAEYIVNNHIPAPGGGGCWTVYHPVLDRSIAEFDGLTPDTNRLQIVIFLTDGKLEAEHAADNSGNRTKALLDAKMMGSKKIRLKTVGFGTEVVSSSDARSLLIEMSSAAPSPNQEDCLLSPSATALDAFYQDIANSICHETSRPVITLFPPDSVTYRQGASAVTIDALATLTQGANVLDGGNLEIALTANSDSNDRITIPNQGTGTGQIGISGSSAPYTVKYENNTIGTYAPASGNEALSVHFSSSTYSTRAAVQALLECVRFDSSSSTPPVGTRTVTFFVNDGHGGTSAAVSKSINVYAPNTAPSVNAGSDQTTLINTSLSLSGSVSDDGKVNATPTITWSVVSKPTGSTVTFGNIHLASTTGTFDTEGTYVLKLSAYDGELTSEDTCTINAYHDTSCATPIAIDHISLDHSTVTGGDGTVVTGTVYMATSVTLNGGQVITITSDTTKAAPLTAVVVSKGVTSATFTITTLPVTGSTTAHITASYPGVTSKTASFTIATANTTTAPSAPSGYTWTIFADNFPVDEFGPIGLVKNNRGEIFVTLPDSREFAKIAIFPDVDGQHYSPSTTKTVFPNKNNPLIFNHGLWALARIGNKLYGTRISGEVVELADDGSTIRVVTPPEILTFGLAGNPMNGLLYATGENEITGESGVIEIDPTTGNSRLIAGVYKGDGLTVSPDGKIVYVASWGTGMVFGYDIATGALVLSVDMWEVGAYGVDGLAVGQGTLAGKLFVNCNSGDLCVIDLETGEPTIFSHPGSRGDFLMVDTDGTLLITQSDRILRFTPPSTGTFGNVISGTIVTRNDQTTGYANMDLGNSFQATSSKVALFDTRGLLGDVVSAYISRPGSVVYSANANFDFEFGIQPYDPLGNNALNDPSFAPRVTATTSSSGTFGYGSTAWLLPMTYAADLKSHLGGDYKVQLVDRISSVCGAVVHDSPPSLGVLTFLVASGTNPRIPTGTSLDISVPGATAPSSGDWDILLDGQFVGSSGSPNDWNVELDQTPYQGVIVTVPASATIANGYQVRIAGSPAKSGAFDVIAPLEGQAPSLLPILLSVNPVPAGNAVSITFSINRPAPSAGITIALSSDNASVVLPNSILIPSGSSSQTITLTVPSGASAGTANISAKYNGERRAALKIRTGTGSAPSTPSGLAATAHTSDVTLSWTSVSGVAYNIKRSRNPGGPYTLVYAGLPASPFVDIDVITGLPYYYVISGQNAFGESANTSEVSATPTGPGTVAAPEPHAGSLYVTLTDDTPQAIIRYTVGGSTPTEASPVYKGEGIPIALTSSTTIKARAYKSGFIPSAIMTATYTYTLTKTLPTFEVFCGDVYDFQFQDPSLSILPDYSVKRPNTYADHVQFSTSGLAAGDVVTIVMTSSDVDSYLYLLGDDTGQTILAENNDATAGTSNAKIEYTVPGATLPPYYYIEIASAHPMEKGWSRFYINKVHSGTLSCPAGVTFQVRKFDGTLTSTLSSGNTVDLGDAYIGNPPAASLVINNTSSGTRSPGLEVKSVQVTGDFGGSKIVLGAINTLGNMEIPLSLLSVAVGNGKAGSISISHNASGTPFIVNLTADVVDAATAPTISITSPGNGTTFDGTYNDPTSVPIQVSISTTHASVSKVEFFATQGATTYILGSSTVSPFSLAWSHPPTGTYSLTAKVTDSNGRTATSSGVSITVGSFSLSGTPNITTTAGTYTGSVAIEIQYNTLPGDATLVFSTNASTSTPTWFVYPGHPVVFNYADLTCNPFTVVARGFKWGSFGSTTSKTFTVNPAGASHPPVANISTPIDGDEVTEPVSIRGSASLYSTDPGTFQSWTLDYHLHDDANSPWITFATGTSPVTPSSGQFDAEFDSTHKFDPTLLMNGLYDIRLSVANAAGDISIDTIVVEVKGKQKIGNFTLSFVDLTVPVAGIPIQVTRTYDSRDKGQGDFGIGWRLGTGGIKVQKSGVLGHGWEQKPFDGGFFSGFEIQPTTSHRVTITLPGDDVYSFEATLNPSSSMLYPIENGILEFHSLSGTKGKLTIVGDNSVDLFPVGAGDGVEFLDAFDDLTLFDATQFDLTMRDGRILRLSANTGLLSITDPNGNVTTFGKNGITETLVGTSTEIPVVTFQRETTGGGLNGFKRITGIYANSDLIGGGTAKPVTYAYGAANSTTAFDLLKVTDRFHTAAADGKGTVFTYDNRHNLVDIADPLNHHVAKNTYDDNGRLIESIDALNNKTTFSYNFNNRQSTIVDPLGNATFLSYDARGNVIGRSQYVNGQLSTTTFAFSDPNNPDSPTKLMDPLGKITLMSYSSDGDLISRTDRMNHTTTYDYNNRGQVTVAVDESGHVLARNDFDRNGNLTRSVDAKGGESLLYYTSDGSIWIVKDALGNTSQFAYSDLVGSVTILDPSTGSTATVTADPAGTGQPTRITDVNGHQTFYVYDKNGSQTHVVTTRTLNDGTTTETIDTLNEYDANGRLTKTTKYAKVPGQSLQSQLQLQNFYTDSGKLSSSIDYTGQTTSFEYDDAGRLTKTTTPDGKITKTEYDAAGRTISTTESASGKSLTTRRTYDEIGRQISVIQPDGSSIRDAYDLGGRRISSTDANGNTVRYVYDNGDHRTKMIDALGHTTTYGYDSTGKETDIVDANGNQTRFEFDENGDQTKTIFSDGTTKQTSYDLVGRKTVEIDQAGVIKRYGYDAMGQLISVTNAAGTADETITQYQYDELGQMTNQVDALQHATAFFYDFIGRKVKRKLPGGQEETTAYSIVSSKLRIQQTDFNGKTTTVDHDEMGRVVTKTPDASFSASAVQFAYDLVTGRRSQMIDASGTTTYTYDALGRVTQKSHTVLGDLNYTYDPVGNVLTVKSSHQSQSGVALTYHYDALNRLLQTDDRNGNSTTYNYDKVGNLQDFTYPTTTPVKTTYHYNSLNRLTDMSVVKGASTSVATFEYNPGSRPLGAAGNRMAAREMIAASTTINRAVSYYYDNLYRLTKEEIDGTITSPEAPTGYLDYGPQTGVSGTGYDAVGNRRSRAVSLSSSVTGFGSVTSTFDSNDRLNSSTYDANGNTKVESLGLQPKGVSAISPDSTHQDVYDSENRLLKRFNGTTTVQMIYDGDGNRVKKDVSGGSSDTRYYLVDDRNPTGYAQVLEELVPGGGGSLTLTRVYNYGHSLISQWQSGGSTFYYGYDGHGNVRFLLDSSGAITDTYTYDAFGVLLKSTGSTVNNNLYCGEQFDFDLGMYYLRARYMNPGSGRFWTLDSNQGTSEDPFSLHKYLYCHDNAVNANDPSGHEMNLIGQLANVAIQAWSGAKTAFSVYNAYARTKYILHNAQEFAMLVQGISDALDDDDDDGEVIRLIGDYISAKLTESIQGFATSVVLNATVGVAGKVAGPIIRSFGKAALKPAGIQKARQLYNESKRLHQNAHKTITTSKGAVTVHYDQHGWPQFGPHAVKTVNVRPLSGSYARDFEAADSAAGITKAWRDEQKLVWHHNQKFGKMELVPREIHKQVEHTGAAGLFRSMYGDNYYAKPWE